MGDGTGIEWTDATWNTIVGCSIHSPGCKNCYAMPMAARIQRMTPGTHYAGTTQPSKAGPVWTGKLALAPDHILTQPLRWRRPRKIFANSMGDLFHEDAPDEWIDRTFAVMALTPHHTYQVLTKRADRMAAYLGASGTKDRVIEEIRGLGRKHDAGSKDRAPKRKVATADDIIGWDCFAAAYNLEHGHTRWPLPNVLLGVSVEDQRRADERREHLAALAKVGWRTFVSYEPALGPVDWSGWEFLTWLISGGESGPHARPSHPDWHRTARDFCAAHGIPFFFKQWGEWRWAPDRAHFKDLIAERMLRLASGRPEVRPAFMVREGKHAAGRLLDGIEHNGMPGARA